VEKQGYLASRHAVSPHGTTEFLNIFRNRRNSTTTSEELYLKYVRYIQLATIHSDLEAVIGPDR
jgi:hypothetical protein